MKKIISLISILLCVTILSSCTFMPSIGEIIPDIEDIIPNIGDTPFDPEHTDAHTDDDDNGLCDKCNISVIVTIDFYAINDLHGKFSTTDQSTGVEGLTTYLKTAYQNDDHYITLSSGDMWQGGAESNLTKGLIVTEWLNEIGAESMTLGNHEFDWGEEAIIANTQVAEFPFLAINIYERATNEPVDYCSPSVVVERGGLQIGIIGAIGDCYSSISSDKVEDVYFKTDDELTALIKDESQRLRSEGADYIVLSIHDGHDESKQTETSISGSKLSSYYDASLSREGYVDLVFEGHTHKNYVLRDTYGVYHMQNGGDNKGISHVEVDINTANDNTKVSHAEFVNSGKYENKSEDEIIQTLKDKYEDEISVAYDVLGTNSSYRSSNYLRQLVADLYLQKGQEIWGDEYDISLGGGYISVRSPYELEAGDVKYMDLMSIFPFDNPLVLCSISGADLKSRFINTDNSDYYISYKSGLADSIVDSKTYYVIVDSYTSQYKYNRLTEIARYDDNFFARDLLAEYIKDGGLE